MERPIGTIIPLKIYDPSSRTYREDPNRHTIGNDLRIIPELLGEELRWATKAQEAKLFVLWRTEGQDVVMRVLAEYLETPGIYQGRYWRQPGWVRPLAVYQDLGFRVPQRQLGEPPMWVWPQGLQEWLGLTPEQWREVAGDAARTA